MIMGFVLIILSFFSIRLEASVIRGEVSSPKECQTSGRTMVWLSLPNDDFKQRLLLMHTLVPDRGSFEFYVKPGAYRIMASNEKGCEFQQVINMDQENKDIKIKLVSPKVEKKP